MKRSCDDQGVKHPADNKGRSRVLLEYVDSLRNIVELSFPCNVVYMFYDGCGNSNKTFQIVQLE